MLKGLFILGVVVSIIWLSGFVFSLSPYAPPDQESSIAPEMAAVTELRVQSEVVESPPAEVLAHGRAAQLGDVYIGLVCGASEGQAIEVWSVNADDASHMLFNRFRVKLPDGSQIQDSIGGEVRPGEWLHVTYQIPHTETGSRSVGFDVELTEPGPCFDHVHDASYGHQVGT